MHQRPLKNGIFTPRPQAALDSSAPFSDPSSQTHSPFLPLWKISACGSPFLECDDRQAVEAQNWWGRMRAGTKHCNGTEAGCT